MYSPKLLLVPLDIRTLRERERERESTETPLPMMELASNETIHTLLPWWRWELAAAANQ